MKKILIGTHNNGKFKEIAYLISKKSLQKLYSLNVLHANYFRVSVGLRYS